LGISTTLTNRWSAAWHWVDSARAWDIEQDRIRILAVQKALAEKAAADAEKWVRRAEELPDMMYAVTVDTFNDLSTTARLALDPNTALPVKDKGIQVRSFVMAAPLAERALEMVARRNRVINAAGATTPVPEGTSGGAKEALRAYQEYQDNLNRFHPDPVQEDEDEEDS
jgi:hypothetical protein